MTIDTLLREGLTFPECRMSSLGIHPLGPYLSTYVSPIRRQEFPFPILRRCNNNIDITRQEKGSRKGPGKEKKSSRHR